MPSSWRHVAWRTGQCAWDMAVTAPSPKLTSPSSAPHALMTLPWGSAAWMMDSAEEFLETNVNQTFLQTYVYCFCSVCRMHLSMHILHIHAYIYIYIYIFVYTTIYIYIYMWTNLLGLKSYVMWCSVRARGYHGVPQKPQGAPEAKTGCIRKCCKWKHQQTDCRSTGSWHGFPGILTLPLNAVLVSLLLCFELCWHFHNLEAPISPNS